MILKQELTEYFQNNRPRFLSRDEISTLAKKKGWFNGHIFISLKEKIISFTEFNEVLFGSTDGFIFTPESFTITGFEFINGKTTADVSKTDRGWFCRINLE